MSITLHWGMTARSLLVLALVLALLVWLRDVPLGEIRRRETLPFPGRMEAMEKAGEKEIQRD